MNINQVYNEEYCKQLEIAYGKGMMSEGGVEEIDYMFTGIDLKNKQILDFGSGLGGASYYLAEKYYANVVGLEINEGAITTARQNLPQNIKNKVSFVLAKSSGKLEFADKTFDVIFSRGVIVHLTIPQRKKMFAEFNRILKTNGQLIIHDWLSPHDNMWSEKVKHLMENEGLPLHAQSPASYQKLLEDAKFKNIQLIDRAAEYAKYNTEIAEKLLMLAEQDQNFVKQFGKETLKKHIDDYIDISKASIGGELLNMFIKAER